MIETNGTGKNGKRMAAATFWLVFANAVVVVLLLGITLIDVANRAERAAETAQRNAQLIEQNQELIETLQTSQEIAAKNAQDAVEAVFCLLLVVPSDRTDADVQRCLNEFHP